MVFHYFLFNHHLIDILGGEISQINLPKPELKNVKKEIKTENGTEVKDVNILEYKHSCVMVAGIQGSGKTTTTAKLGLRFKNFKMKVLMVSLDVYRPAAQEQLKILGEKCKVDTLPISQEDLLTRRFTN